MQVQGSYFEQGASSYVSQAAEEKKAVASAPGRLFTLDVVNAAVADRYIYVFDSLSATGTLLFPPVKASAGGLVSIEYKGTVPFSTGLYVASSTTQATYTASTTSDLMMRAVYKS